MLSDGDHISLLHSDIKELIFTVRIRNETAIEKSEEDVKEAEMIDVKAEKEAEMIDIDSKDDDEVKSKTIRSTNSRHDSVSHSQQPLTVSKTRILPAWLKDAKKGNEAPLERKTKKTAGQSLILIASRNIIEVNEVLMSF